MSVPNIAFYAPIKPPDHPIPSGDREIARLLIKALECCGYDVALASRYIAYQKRPLPELFEECKSGGEAEARRLIAHYREAGAPDIWFTYHPYCKAADWIGPEICREFGIPYVTAEAARTGQGADSDWTEARAEVQSGVASAAVNFCLKQSDWEYLQSFLPTMANVVKLVPFVDADGLREQAQSRPSTLPLTNRDPVIVTAGMMRPGWKWESYRQLAAALQLVTDISWNLVVIGDGPMRTDVENALSFIPSDRLHFTGAVDKDAMPGLLAAGDIFAWPGLREAIGMVFLEAQALGVPVAAMKSLGVPLVVADGRSGLLANEPDSADFAGILRSFLMQVPLRQEFGAEAARYVDTCHGIASASTTIKAALDPLLADQ